MAELTKLTGTYIRSGSIPTTALSGGVVSSSLQVVSALPGNTVSSSAQVTALLPTDTVSSSAQVKNFLPEGTISASSQYPGWVTSSAQVDYTQLQNIPAGIASSSAQVTAYLPVDTVSSSVQVDITNTTNYTTFSSSLATADTTQTSRLAALENVTGSYATTGSNIFVGTQSFSNTTNTTSYLDGAIHVAGGMSIRQDLRVSGSVTINGLLTAVSMSTQYVTASQYNVGVSKITLNDDDTVRFAGISIYDSGSSSPTSASIFWDSLQHRFIYENLSGSAYNSSIIIAGPKHTGSLGDEPTLTSGYIPVATGTDHIDNSVMFQSSSNIGIGTTTPDAALHLYGPFHNENAGALRITTTQGEGITYSVKTQSYPSASNEAIAIFDENYGYRLAHFGSYVAGISIAGVDRIHINSSGNVGIGTTFLSSLFTVAGDTDLARTQFGPLTALRVSRINPSNGATLAAAYLQNYVSGSENNLSLSPYGGNVGIGTTNPSYLLDVQKSDAGNVVDFRITNTESANAASGTRAIVQTNGASAGDPRLVLSVAGVREYCIGIDNSDSDKFKINDGSDPSSGTNYLTIDTSGNVSLGLSSASEKLLVYTNADSRNKVRIRNDSSGSSARAELIVNAYGNSWGLGMGSAANNSNAFYIREDALDVDTVRVSILTGGNVGIGITNPGNKLSVSSIVGISGAVGGGATVPSTSHVASSTLRLGLRGSVMTSDDSGLTTVGTYLCNNVFFKNSSGNPAYLTTNPASAILLTDNVTIFRRAASGTADTDITFSESARIDSSGNVGIGITNPSTKLHAANLTSDNSAYQHITYITANNSDESSGEAYDTTKPSFGIGFRRQWSSGTFTNIASIHGFGSGNWRGGLLFRTKNNTSSSGEPDINAMILSPAGNVGIGTTNPNNLLTVRGVSAQVDIQSTADSQVPGIFMRYIDSSTAGAKIYYATGNAVTYYDNLYSYSESTVYGSHDFRSKNASDVLTSRLYIRGNTGNVGIGTTNPTSLLHVYGTTQLYAGSAGNSPALILGGETDAAKKAIFLESYWMVYQGHDNEGHKFRSVSSSGTATDDVVIKGNGNVGIGTTDPGNFRLRVPYSGVVTNAAPVEFNGPGTAAWGIGLVIRTTGGTDGAAILFRNRDSKNWQIRGETSGTGFQITEDGGDATYGSGFGTVRVTIAAGGNVLPGANGTQDLGSSSLRWSTVYTSDLSLSNGIGDWTIVEGEDDLFIYNNKNNKVYKFTLQEVDPSTATPKKS